MDTDFEDYEEDPTQPEEEEIDWMQYAVANEEESLRPLDGKDYIAIFVASLQTIFLPLIVLIIVLIAFNFWLQALAG